MEELHTDSIDGGHEANYGARSRAGERAYSNMRIISLFLLIVTNPAHTETISSISGRFSLLNLLELGNHCLAIQPIRAT
jgi:hypothetical protein